MSENKDSWNSFCRYRKIMICCQSLALMCYALYFIVQSQMMYEFTLKYNTDYKHISYVIAVRGLGNIIGAPLGGKLKDKYICSAELILGGVLICASVSLILMPFCESLWTLSLLILFIGTAFGILNVVNTASVIGLWQKRSAGVLNLIYCVGTIGNIIGPMIMEPFISPKEVHNPTKSIPPHWELNTTMAATRPQYKGDVYKAFLIMAVIHLFCGVLPLLTYIFRGISNEMFKEILTKLAEENRMEVLPSHQRKGEDKCFKVFCYLLMTAYLMLLTFGYFGCFEYFFPVAISKPLDFSNTGASVLNAVLGGVMPLSRLMFAFVLQFWSVVEVLNVALFGSILSAAFVTFMGLQTKVAFWVSTVIFMFLFSGTYPCAIAYTNCFVQVTGFVVSLFELSLSFAWILSTVLSGYLLDTFGSWTIWLEATLSNLLCFIITLSIYFVSLYKDKKHNCEEEEFLSKN